jgi:PglZ domain
MSYAVCRELCEDFRRHGWIEWTDQPGQSLPFLLGTVPSVTEMSRASLFAGKLIRGNSTAEKRDFAAHTDLLAVSHPGYPPVVFHKGEIVEAGATGISETVREALQNTHQKVVGVVLNAVDDHLAKSEQLRLSWSISQFQHLDALLYEARLARRAIVLTSDHGHVLEDGTRQLQHSTEERWRAFDAPLATAEMVFAGPRVKGVTGMPRIIALWSETARYSRKKQGYHGGATPQEVLVPLAVLTSQHASIAGWEALPEYEPAWWRRAESARQETPSMPVPPTLRPKKSTATQGSLFETAATGSPRQLQGDWIERLLDSPVFASQQRLAGRKAPKNAMVRAALKALDGQQDGLSRRMLGQVLGLAELPMRRLLAGLQRLLNVDGYQVIVVDEASDIVELNRRLLDKQFQLLRG